MTGLAGRVAIVTGAASGMGRAHALRLAALGAAVALQDIDEVGLGETAGAIAADGGTAVACGFDIADVAAIDRMAQSLMGRFGRIDIVVNNAGIGIDRPIEAIDAAAFDRMIGIHVKGSFFCARAAVPAMKAQRWGRIVNISSRWAQAGHTLASDYIAAKAALLGLTKAWAKELAPWNIHVNAVAPGGVVTEMVLAQPDIEAKMAQKVARVPLGRYAEPRELSYTVAFLASPQADFITGQVISPNGGEVIVGI